MSPSLGFKLDSVREDGISNFFIFLQVMQLSDKSCELAEENDRLYDKNKEQVRKIELLEAEQSELVRRERCQIFFDQIILTWNLRQFLSAWFISVVNVIKHLREGRY